MTFKKLHEFVEVGRKSVKKGAYHGRKKELETVENPQEVEASQPEKEEKMVSVAEMQRRLKQMEEKHTLEIADMQTGIQAQIEEAVAKAKMSEEELQELQQKQRDKRIRRSPEHNCSA